MAEAREGERQAKLSSIIIEVPDLALLQKCRSWYENLGLTPNGDTPGESTWFDLGNGASLGIHLGKNARPAGFSIGIEVSDVDDVYRRLRAAGTVFESAPATKSWGRSAGLIDPLGVPVRLMSRTVR